jgi:hypothetical protein
VTYYEFLQIQGEHPEVQYEQWVKRFPDHRSPRFVELAEVFGKICATLVESSGPVARPDDRTLQWGNRWDLRGECLAYRIAIANG